MTDKTINKRRHWSREDCFTLLKLDSASPRPTHQALGERFGVTAHAVAMKLVKLRRGESLPKASAAPYPAKPSAAPRPELPHQTKMQIHRRSQAWTSALDKIVLERCTPGDVGIFRKVADDIGRTYHATRQRFYTLKRLAQNLPEHPTVKTVRQSMDERVIVAGAPLRYASPFAELLGEPPIGRSALDQKRAGTSA